MPVRWRCGGRDCPGHRARTHVCGAGGFVCRRLRPACPGHHSRADVCAEVADDQWTCRAHNCPGHSGRDHLCDTTRQPPPHWYCNRDSPPCVGHSLPPERYPQHHCNETLSQGEEEAARQCDANRPVGNPVQPCPVNDRARLVEVAEWVRQSGGDWRTQAVVTRHQFINHDGERGHPEKGRRIRLRARVEWASGERGRSLVGQTVYWYFRPAGGNRAGLGSHLVAGFDSVGSGALRTTSRTDADGWTTTVEFYPSQYGGDSFEVFATDDPAYAGGMSAGTYTVWRRVFYELDCMKRPGEVRRTYSDRADTAAMERKFREVFIEAVRTGTDAHPPHRRTLSGDTINPWARNVRNGSGSPRYFHLLLVDTIASSTKLRLQQTFHLFSTSDRIELPASTYNLDMDDWLIDASYTQSGATRPISPESISRTEVGTPSTPDNKFVVTIDFPSVPFVSLSSPLRVNLTFWSWNYLSGLQTSDGPCTTIGMRWREQGYHGADIVNSVLNTMVHEPAHSMGMVATNLPHGSPHPHQYMIPGGSHCRALSNRCIMYEANSPSITICPDCADALRGRQLDSIPMSGNAGY